MSWNFNKIVQMIAILTESVVNYIKKILEELEIHILQPNKHNLQSFSSFLILKQLLQLHKYINEIIQRKEARNEPHQII